MGFELSISENLLFFYNIFLQKSPLNFKILKSQKKYISF